MECGVESAMLWGSGGPVMPKLFATNLGSREKVSSIYNSMRALIVHQLSNTDAYILEPNIARFGTSHRDAVIGEVYCVAAGVFPWQHWISPL